RRCYTRGLAAIRRARPLHASRTRNPAHEIHSAYLVRTKLLYPIAARIRPRSSLGPAVRMPPSGEPAEDSCTKLQAQGYQSPYAGQGMRESEGGDERIVHQGINALPNEGT